MNDKAATDPDKTTSLDQKTQQRRSVDKIDQAIRQLLQANKNKELLALLPLSPAEEKQAIRALIQNNLKIQNPDLVNSIAHRITHKVNIVRERQE